VNIPRIVVWFLSEFYPQYSYNLQAITQTSGRILRDMYQVKLPIN